MVRNAFCRHNHEDLSSDPVPHLTSWLWSYMHKSSQSWMDRVTVRARRVAGVCWLPALAQTYELKVQRETFPQRNTPHPPGLCLHMCNVYTHTHSTHMYSVLHTPSMHVPYSHTHHRQTYAYIYHTYTIDTPYTLHKYPYIPHTNIIHTYTI